jgi:hypothetical protein
MSTTNTFKRHISTSLSSSFNPAADRIAMLRGLYARANERNKRFCCLCSKEKPTLGGKFPDSIKRLAVERFHCADCLAMKAFDPVI